MVGSLCPARGTLAAILIQGDSAGRDKVAVAGGNMEQIWEVTEPGDVGADDGYTTRQVLPKFDRIQTLRE